MSRHIEDREVRPGGMSRRMFLAAAGMVAAGGALATSAVASVTGAKEAPAGTTPPLPWTWVKLDPQEAAKRTFQNYHAKGG